MAPGNSHPPKTEPPEASGDTITQNSAELLFGSSAPGLNRRHRKKIGAGCLLFRSKGGAVRGLENISN